MRNPLFQKEIFIPSTAEGLDRCIDIASEIGKLFDFDYNLSFALHTVLVESIENAFIHGNKSVRDLEVRVFILVNKSEIFVEVEDKGEGFDLNAIPSPVEGTNIFNESGRGLFFIKSFSSSCYTVGKGNIIRIKIDR